MGSLMEMGEVFLANELAESWAVTVSAEARALGLEAKALIESTHLRLPASVDVVIVDDEALLPQMLDRLLREPVVGLDAEWAVGRGSPASLLQIAGAKAVFLVDLLTIGTSGALGSALANV